MERIIMSTPKKANKGMKNPLNKEQRILLSVGDLRMIAYKPVPEVTLVRVGDPEHAYCIQSYWIKNELPEDSLDKYASEVLDQYKKFTNKIVEIRAGRYKIDSIDHMKPKIERKNLLDNTVEIPLNNEKAL